MHTGSDGEGALELADDLRTAIGRFVRATKGRVGSMPLTRVETLGLLRRAESLTMAELAEARGVSHQSVSRMVGDLEGEGLVVKAPHPRDGRGFALSLTDSGRALLDEELRARTAVIADAVASCLSKREQDLLAQVPAVLDRLTAGLLLPATDVSD